MIACLGGCSIAIVGPDPARHPRATPTCETSKSLVKLDVAMAIGLGVIGGALISANAGTDGSVALLGGALYAAAAVRGNNRVDACRESFEQYDREIAAGPPRPDDEAAPTRLPPRRLPGAPPAPRSAPLAPRPAPVTAAAVTPSQPATSPTQSVQAQPDQQAPPASTTDDAFHSVVGEQPPPRSARRLTTPAPAMSPWREFWREVP